MDSDEERPSSRCGRANDMDQMRSGSSSPSAISTASSGSPLVRGHSKGATGVGGASASSGGLKRPAPTSIAAAQLQCQQHRVALESSSSPPAPAPMKSATSSSLDAGSGHSTGARKSEKQPKLHEDNKGFGYNVAKSIAYRAYRFNESWTMDKMSYLNLACLLMTLVCLITIVLFSASSGNQQASPRSVRLGQASMAAQKFHSAHLADEEAEPIPEPSSQSPGQKDDSPLSPDELAGAGNSPTTDYPDDEPWPVRQSAGVAKLRRKSGPEREIEDSPPPTADSEQQQTSSPTSSIGTPEGENQQQRARGSLLEPILSQIFKDLNLEPMLKDALNGTGNKQLKPIVRRIKNGATIIISSSFNDTSPLANGSLSGLLQKLLPPMLFKQTNQIDGAPAGPIKSMLDEDANLAGSATITISGRAFEPPASPSLFDAPGLFGGLASSPAAPWSRFRAFFPEPMAMRMNSLVSAPSQFAAMPYPSPLGMMLRSMAADVKEEISSTSPVNVPTKPANQSETLSAQASQQQQQRVAGLNKTQNATADPEVETFDVPQMVPLSLPSPGSRHRSRVSLLSPAGQQSVMIFGPSSNDRELGSFMPDPFAGGLPMPMPIPVPHMMMLASGGSDSRPLVTPGSPSIWSSGGRGGSLMPAPFNPILRAILSELAGGSSATAIDPEGKNKTTIDRSDQTTVKLIRPFFSPIDMMDSLASQFEDSDGKQTSSGEGVRQMRARHANMLLDEPMDSPDTSGPASISDLMDQQTFDQQQQSGGVVRQTIRGPAMTVERIIEVPAPAVQQKVQQVPPGVRSQSISALLEDLNENSSGSDEQPSWLLPSGRRNRLPSASTIERRDEGSMMEATPMMMPHRMSFIGKLLADFSRRATSPRVLLNRSDLDDQMVDDSAEAKPDQLAPPAWAPSARIRIRPASSTPEAVFLSPIIQQLPQVGDHEGSSEATGESAEKISLEDTLNSMEDRLDKVLSMASQYTSTPGSHRAIITPVEKPKQIDRQGGSGEARSENPYTSPTSPLFGFPASSAPSSSSSSTSGNSFTSGEDKKNNRESRSFTYHSNNELASGLKMNLAAAAAKQRENEQRDSDLAEMRAESTGRASKFGPFLAPPAGAMGRRLDDGPFEDSSSLAEQQQQQQEATNPTGSTFLEGRAMMPATGSHSSRPAAPSSSNNKADHFRTIVV